MKLSDGEKIIIAMLADMHKAMGIEGETDVERLMASIYGGHLWSLKWDLTGLLHDHEDSPQEVEETTNILNMWSFIERSFGGLDDAAKEKVRAVNYGHDPEFAGFDGNNEGHFSIAKHLVEVTGRFEDFKGRSLNSHSSVVPHYLRMYAVFQPLYPQLGMRPNVALTANELIEILGAK
ncbi:YfbU family protein [Leisingera sp. M523]|uniref:YfbU family protein n=1 Tax=Leisingera sp. M523 TaxID=2867013 RepID=UPI0021A71C3C|nr:YfbU family protein [Leisingera sp. M523]UWQ30243.1 YfbU family protein [Leisingera sp. M523]